MMGGWGWIRPRFYDWEVKGFGGGWRFMEAFLLFFQIVCFY